jgi:hypothetical protein
MSTAPQGILAPHLPSRRVGVDLREFDEPQEAVLHFELDVADGARRSFKRGVASDFFIASRTSQSTSAISSSSSILNSPLWGAESRNRFAVICLCVCENCASSRLMRMRADRFRRDYRNVIADLIVEMIADVIVERAT